MRFLLVLLAGCYTPPDLPTTPYDTPILSSEGSVVETCAPSRAVRVSAVSDGDTITISSGGVEDTIRLLGVNTPESVSEPAECMGETAHDVAAAVLVGQLATLTFDRECTDNDTYQRTLAYVWIDPDLASQYLNRNVVDEMLSNMDTDNPLPGLLFNEYLVRAGLACWYDREHFLGKTDLLYQDNNLITAERIARARKMGIWSTCDGEYISRCDDFQLQP